MITEGILTVFFTPITLLLGSFNFAFPMLTLPIEFIGGVIELFSYIGWLLPLSAILPVLAFKWTLMAVNIIWKLALRVKSFIPTFGT